MAVVACCLNVYDQRMRVLLHIFCSLLILFAGSTFASQVSAVECGTSSSLSCATDCCSDQCCDIRSSVESSKSTSCCAVGNSPHSEVEVAGESEDCPCSTSDCACCSTAAPTFMHVASNVDDCVLSSLLHQSDDLLLSRHERPSSPPPKS